MNIGLFLGEVPDSLRIELVDEYNKICQHYLEGRWMPAEVGGGRFAEIVYTILLGRANGNYPITASKPTNMLDACKALENKINLPRGLRILIPRILPALYEIRNNRDAGHVGGDVNSNSMDSTVVVGISSWIMGELVREFHNVSPEEAQRIVDFITNRKIPLIWEKEDIKRVLKPRIALPLKILLLLSSETSPTTINSLVSWLDTDTKKYILSQIRILHTNREVEYNEIKKSVQILPPGTKKVEDYLSKLS